MIRALVLMLLLQGCAVISPCDVIEAQSGHGCLYWIFHPEDQG